MLNNFLNKFMIFSWMLMLEVKFLVFHWHPKPTVINNLWSVLCIIVSLSRWEIQTDLEFHLDHYLVLPLGLHEKRN